jgi:hypothetical protein
MMHFFFPQADGSILILSWLEPPYHGTTSLIIPAGEEFCPGLPYEAALQYFQIETDDGGNFVSGEKRQG